MKLEINTKSTLNLLADFYSMAKVRMVVFDVDFNHVIGYPDENCKFCGLMKSDPASRRLCRESDMKACEICKKTDSLYIHRCHAGLIEVVAPIKMDDIILGYIMFGQIREEGTSADEIISYLLKRIKDESVVCKAVSGLEEKSIGQIESMARLLEACASYLWTKEFIKADESNNLIYRLSNYINNNIRNELTVEVLCGEFGLSRSRLYDVSHKYFGMSIAKYIRKKKTSIAAGYLEDGYRVSEAAEAAGFYDYNYFSKVFKAEYGMTPQRYRKKY